MQFPIFRFFFRNHFLEGGFILQWRRGDCFSLEGWHLIFLNKNTSIKTRQNKFENFTFDYLERKKRLKVVAFFCFDGLREFSKKFMEYGGAPHVSPSMGNLAPLHITFCIWLSSFFICLKPSVCPWQKYISYDHKFWYTGVKSNVSWVFFYFL